jgi:hypothetical protein
VKRTLVERVAKLANGISYCGDCGNHDTVKLSIYYARRIIAMVRRHDRKAGKR